MFIVLLGAVVRVNAIVSFDATKTYTIRNIQSGLYLSVQSGHSETNVVNATPLVSTPVEFTIKGDEANGFSLCCNNLYVVQSSNKSWNSASTSTESRVWTILEASGADKYYIKQKGSGEKTYLKYDGNNPYAYTNGNTTGDGYVVWEIKPVVGQIDVTYHVFDNSTKRKLGDKVVKETMHEAPIISSLLPSYVHVKTGLRETVESEEENLYVDADLPFITSTSTNPVWYSVYQKNQNSNMYWRVVDGSTTLGQIKENNSTLSTEPDNYCFRIEGDWLNGFYFYNKVSGTGITIPNPTEDHSTITMSDSPTRLMLLKNGSEWYLQPSGQPSTSLLAAWSYNDNFVAMSVGREFFNGSRTVFSNLTPAITYVYKYGETEWYREIKYANVGDDYPDLRMMPNGVRYVSVPYGKVTGNETIEIECTVDDKYDIPFSSSYGDAKWLYTTVHSGSKYFWSYDSSTKRVKTNVTTFSSAKNQEAYQWAIIGNPIAGFQIINKAAGADKILTSASPKDDGANGGNTFPVMSNIDEVPDGYNTRWNINAYDFGYAISREGESINLNRRGGDLAYWTGKDQGSRIGFFPVDEAIVVQNPMEGGRTYQARNLMSGEVITDFIGKTISKGNVDGCYHLSSAASVTTTPAIFYASQSLSATENPVQWSSLSAFSEWIVEEKPAEHTYTDVSSLTSGRYYRLTSYIDATRHITESNGVLYAYTSSDTGYDQIWKFTKSGSNWTMQNMLSQNYVQSSKNGNNAYTTGSTAATIVLTNNGTAEDGRTYFMLAPSNAITGYFNNSKSAQSYRIVPWHVTTDESSFWYIQEVNITDADVEAANDLRTEIANKANILANASTYNSALRTFFSDNACTQLRDSYANMTDADLRDAMSFFPVELQEMAVCVKNDRWDENATKNRYIKDFRIHNYDIYSDPDVWAMETKVGRFGNLYHPTGITCKAGELLYVMVGDNVKDSDAHLELGITPGTNNNPSQTITLQAGLNVIMPNVDGEAFVIYRLTNKDKLLDEYPDIKVHIEGGEATGCFDMHRGHTNNDWAYLCSNMFTNEYLHIMAENSVINCYTEKVRGAKRLTEVLRILDWIFITEEKLIGHDGQWNGRYNPVIVIRDQISGNPNWSGTSINLNNINTESLNFESLMNERWVYYHEEAHGHQYPVNLVGTTESSNNGLAQMVNHEFGISSRRADGVKTLVRFKNNGWGWVDMLRGGEGASRTAGFVDHDACVWVLNHMFYQLYLYFHVAGNKPDFWPRLCDKMREYGGLVQHGNDANNPTLYYEDYLLFAKACAAASETDLSEFFDTWGFFGYYEDVKVGNEYEAFSSKDKDDQGIRYVGDYGHYYLKMPMETNQEDVNRIEELRTFMKSQPKKAPNIMFIDDHILDRTVSNDCFAAQMDPSLIGQPVAFYSETGRQGDFGDFAQFTGTNEASNLDYSISGNTVTMTGDGLVGVKIYDADGNLKYIYNTNTFELKDGVADKLNNGTYTLVAALGNDTNLPLAKPSATKYEMAVYNGKSEDVQTYKVSGESINANIPYSATTAGTDVPKLTGNAVALVEDLSTNDLIAGNAPSLRGKANVFYNNGTEQAPVWTAQQMAFEDKADFFLPDGDFSALYVTYPRTNTSGRNSVCLPFALEKENLPSGSMIYTLSEIGETSITLCEVESVKAGEFCIIDCQSGDNWEIGLYNTESKIPLIGTPIEADAQGSFQNKSIGDGCYKLNSDGTAFGRTTANGKVTAFRGYLKNMGAGAPARIDVNFGDVDVTEITDVECETAKPSVAVDLQGRRTMTFKRGKVYVINGKKVLIR